MSSTGNLPKVKMPLASDTLRRSTEAEDAKARGYLLHGFIRLSLRCSAQQMAVAGAMVGGGIIAGDAARLHLVIPCARGAGTAAEAGERGQRI
jgi:hypothetical protein